MNTGLRAGIAYIAGRLISGRQSNHVYDYSRGKHIAMSGSVETGQINLYDHGRGAHITGSGTQLFDQSEGCHVSLQLNGNQFSGFDYGAGRHFNGNVNGSNISLYDYKERKHFQYAI